MQGLRSGMSAFTVILFLAAVGGGYYAAQAGILSGVGGSSNIDGVTVSWADDGQPPECGTTSDGFTITAIAEDENARLDEAGELGFQWRSDEGWKDFKRSPTQCSSGGSAYLCRASTGYGLTEETTYNGAVHVRPVLKMPNGTATGPAVATRVVENTEDCS